MCIYIYTYNIYIYIYIYVYIHNIQYAVFVRVVRGPWQQFSKPAHSMIMPAWILQNAHARFKTQRRSLCSLWR